MRVDDDDVLHGIRLGAQSYLGAPGVQIALDADMCAVRDGGQVALRERLELTGTEAYGDESRERECGGQREGEGEREAAEQ